MNKIPKKEILILFLCLFVGFALRLYTLDQKSLWLDEIYTFQDSRDGFIDQLRFYKDNPSYLHPPLFFLLTHSFYPFTKPERDLRIIPLIFGTFSIPMIYLLAKQFSSNIVLPCTLFLTFMTYHISLSQDGRSYSMLMFFGMVGLYFFMKHLQTLKKSYLFLVALFFSILFHTSYTAIPFIIFSQILWFYRPSQENRKPSLSSFLTLNGLILLFCLPWIIFVATHYKGQPIIDPAHTESPSSLWYILNGVLHDWVPHAPLMVVSTLLLILFPIFSKYKKNTLILLAIFVLPIGGFYLFCKLLNITHFVTSRYFIQFLPLFFITLSLSLNVIEVRFEWLKRFLRLRLLFVTLFIFSNLIILPLYYRSEKQDFKGLVNYLKEHLKEGDKIIVVTNVNVQGLLHYFGIIPAKSREYPLFMRKVSENEIEYYIPLSYKGNNFTISYSSNYRIQYIKNGNRIWLIVDKMTAKAIHKIYPFSLKGYFDGSFLNLNRFPMDASMYLFLWDPFSPGEKGIDTPIE